MRKWIKITLFFFLGLIIIIGAALGFFMYKVKYGIARYETEKPEIELPTDRPAILLFSKTTGFRHEAAITASKPLFADLAEKNDWYLYETEKAGVINEEQLSQFEVVIWNNSTGRCLTDEQRVVLQNYVENGGGLIGIHGAGDDSHNWDWYENNLLGTRFSHHPVKNHLQKTEVLLKPLADSLIWRQLPQTWTHTDEWYVFFDNPQKKDFNLIYTIDGEKIDPNGNILWVSSKDFGMGKDHPVAWFKNIEQGRTFYSSMGHTGETFSKPEFIQLIQNAIHWAGKIQ